MNNLLPLSQDVDDEGGEGDEGAGDGDPDGGGGTDGRVAGLHLVWLDIDDIVLLQVIVRRVDDVRIVEVDGMDLLTALGVLTDELHTVADTIDGEVAGLGQGLEDVDLLVADSEHTGTVDFTDDGDLVVGHADGDNRILLGIHVALDLVVDEFLTHGLRETTNLQGADNGEVDAAVVIDQIGLQRTTCGSDTPTGIQRVVDEEIEGL